MIFSPNKTERYIAILRNTFQMRILKNGLRKRYLKSLKKIYFSETLIFREDPQPLAMEAFCAETLTAIMLKKLLLSQRLDFFLDIDGNYMVRQKLFTATLLCLAEESDNVKITINKGRLIVCSKLSDTKTISKLAKKLGGSFLYEQKTKKIIFTTAFEKTQKKTRDFEKAYALLENPLSVVNFYLSAE